MLPGWAIFASAIAYLLLLFAVASFGDRRLGRARLSSARGRPIVYALSITVYCTSWTYFGGVGLAAERGWEFAAIYIGPILMFTLGMPLIRRIIELAKAEKITSAADFVAARYGKNPTVALIVALISLVSAIPYIALQLKAVSSSVAAMVPTSEFAATAGEFSFSSLPLLVTILLAFFAIMFGTRHTDATEHQDGLILAIAMESVVKLMAFATAGIFVVFFLYDGPTALWSVVSQNTLAVDAMNYETSLSRWLLLITLSAFAIIMLPRQFHVTVVENRTASELKMAGFLFPLYLIAINFFVLPIALAGVTTLGQGGDTDLYILNLPLFGGAPIVSLITFIGGFSAATAMVIVASVALSIMISNDIVLPILLRRRLTGTQGLSEDYTKFLLRVRRTAIFGVLFLGYAYYRSTDETAALASIGTLAFAAIAQIAPSMLGGLIWHRANARGAIAGMASGIGAWAYFLLLPSLGYGDEAQAGSLLGQLFPAIHSIDDPFVEATFLALFLNVAAYIIGSLSRRPRALESIQAGVFIRRQSGPAAFSRGWKSRVSLGELKAAVAGYLGDERMQRSFRTYERQSGRMLSDDDPADTHVVHFAEQVLAGAIGSSSARLVLSLLLQKVEEPSSETAWLLGQASEALLHNQDMLHTALSQMDQGIAVFDLSNNLMIWNRRFRELLDLPEFVGQVGFPLSGITEALRERGDVSSSGSADPLIDFLTPNRPFSLTVGESGRIVEVRTNPMPGKGIVTTYTDITQQVAADKALKQANETLEQRVAERTSELVRVNSQLADARAAAEEANIGKTRFFAAAGHDILQPLNAARLYSSTLVEKLGQSQEGELVENIDSSLQSVENILGAVLDISRLDTGAMKARFSTVSLDDFLRRIETDFAPIARERNLKLHVVPSSLHVRTDPTLLRRLVQNLVSNAIKYTVTGKVVVGVRRRGDAAIIQVSDTGIGIPASKFQTVFKEFARLNGGMKTAAGLGLGLSIVDRIGRVLNHKVELASTENRGTTFRVTVPLAQAEKQKPPASALPVQAAASALGGLSVLCIDNELTILDGMSKLLSAWGCTVACSQSLADVHRRLASGAKPDVIVADYHLDDGTGLDAIRLLRDYYGAEVPALLITADRTPDVRARAEADNVTMQGKPVKPAALRAYLMHIAAQNRVAAE
ncbi:PAS domain-containing hybrid sensor histidine kinase/response regulator [Rhizobium sp. L1K21]|uniref:hybrid sensor histidine kinase/response regulator n=1 Tax=Rhizobium sp. L1K21 TaxID=2954933 RepID=UPI002092A7B6|nr:PAS domain-containing hybrid sensor histidine kinase/response regulator [Rhizobium sp. L1K21]MCO6187158.1 hybrid sensor histidine kinase/response regulator [Rhizobium sp. L1K21]